MKNMKKIVTLTVLALTLILPLTVYAGGSWTYENQILPSYQGGISSSSQTKKAYDASAKAISWTDYDFNISAFLLGRQVSGRATVYNGSYSYSNYYNGFPAPGNKIYLRLNSTAVYTSNHIIHYNWSPDEP